MRQPTNFADEFFETAAPTIQCDRNLSHIQKWAEGISYFFVYFFFVMLNYDLLETRTRERPGRVWNRQMTWFGILYATLAVLNRHTSDGRVGWRRGSK